MKKIVITYLLLFIILGAYSQQRPLSTLFMTNPFAINPAIAGTYNYYQIVSNNRFQWVGFKDAPITNTLSFFGPFEKYPMGWGATVSYDVAGSISLGSLYGSYSYYYTIQEDLKISMGLNFGFMQFAIDMSKPEFHDAGDPVYDKVLYKVYVPDASVGVYLYSTTYHVGFVATQLINSKLKIGEQTTGLSKLKSHFYLVAGYKYFINREWAVEPSMIIKKVAPAPYQLDFNIRGWYMNMLWFGLSYRTQEAISILAGYIYDRKIQIGYAYDFVLNPLQRYSYGSHELILNYRFNRIKD